MIQILEKWTFPALVQGSNSQVDEIGSTQNCCRMLLPQRHLARSGHDKSGT
jgi:hypothetical protein